MIKQHPLVSILIPLYNCADFIVETLQSCVNQSYDNIEVVVVDDGSTDNSLEIAKRYSKLHPQITVYSQPNSGGCRARNTAFEKSHGDLIVYLDADDIISNDKIEAQVKLLEGKTETTICTSPWDRFYFSSADASFPDRVVYHDYESGISLIEDLLNGGMFGVTCYMTPRYLIESAGVWDESLLVNQDGEFFIRVLINADHVIYSGHGKLYYRSSTSDSISRKPSEKKGRSLIAGYKKIHEELKSLNKYSQRMAVGLSTCMHSVAYQYRLYPTIIKQAKLLCFEIAGNKKVDIPGGQLFKLSCKLLGFWNTLLIKNLLRMK